MITCKKWPFPGVPDYVVSSMWDEKARRIEVYVTAVDDDIDLTVVPANPVVCRRDGTFVMNVNVDAFEPLDAAYRMATACWTRQVCRHAHDLGIVIGSHSEHVPEWYSILNEVKDLYTVMSVQES